MQVTPGISPRWKLPFSRDELEELLAAMLAAAGQPEMSAELVVLADADMERLHAESLGRRGPTNILSFPFARGGFAGSLALSADTLARECFLYGQAPEAHCIRLLAHGLAHLLGYEHGSAMDELCARMEEAARAARPGPAL